MSYTISAAARLSNLSLDLIRAWERRYGIVEPGRDASGVRLYSDRDVARLRLAAEATRLGHPIRRVARLSNDELQRLLEREPPSESGNTAVVRRLLEAVRAGDPGTASQILRDAVLLTAPRDLVFEILAPALREIGRQWELGEISIWQEHFLSSQMLGLGTALRQAARSDARVVFATPPFEWHGFGIELAALLAAARGIVACNLGVAVPADELVAAARKLMAAAVVVGITQQAVWDRQALEYARSVLDALPRSIELIVGGPAARRIADSLGSARVRAAGTLEEFDAICSQWR